MKLVLMCDYGLDDAAATYDAVFHAQTDGYSEIVLVAIGGNVPSEIALRNAKKLAGQFAFSHPPITVVDTTAEAQPSEYLKTIHGGDGMGDLFEEVDCSVSVIAFGEWLKELNGAYCLLSLGPMTLVPRVLEKKTPERFVFMGGNISEVPNFHGYEFNHALDRSAFAKVVKRYSHVAVTMDTCRNPLLNIQQKEIVGEDIPHRIVRRSRELTFTSGEKGCYIWDDMAVKYLRHPDWFETYVASDKDGNVLTVAKYIYPKEYLEIIEE